VNALEMDHADIFRNEDDILQQFRLLVAITKKGLVILDGPSSPRPKMLETLASEAKARGLKVLRFGFDGKSDFKIKKQHKAAQWTSDAGEKQLGTELHVNQDVLLSPMLGEHQKLNVTAVLAVLQAAGKTSNLKEQQAWLKNFLGIRRRLEILETSDRDVLIEDFAHHPTAYEYTLKSVRESFAQHKLAVFMEFHSATAASDAFHAELLRLLPLADVVFLKRVNRQKSSISLTGENLNVDALAAELKGKVEVLTGASALDLVAAFAKWRSVQSASCVELVMSNGSFENIYGLLKEKLFKSN
jgi:UDP-N-acetylmuramate: L-alanyl-gamma-D-glutamyl-meso-diaminopimelate ligase